MEQRKEKIGIYLAAFKAKHNVVGTLIYQDINGNRDIAGDMLDIDLSKYDYIIATPPCNFWSICNYRRYSSKYALQTRHLLPMILLKLINCGKPFIVENVRNAPLMYQYGLFNLPLFIYEVGRHTYWSNLFLPLNCAEQRQDFLYGGKVIKYTDMDNNDHQGGFNVHKVIDIFLDNIGVLKNEKTNT